MSKQNSGLKPGDEAVRRSADDRQSLDEAWSSLMDGQASEFEVQRLLKSSDEECLVRWNRYQLVRSVLHNEMPDAGMVDLREGVTAALEQDSDGLVVAGVAKRAGRALGGVAIAASVAVVAVVAGLGLRDGELPGLQSGQPAELVAEATVSPSPADAVQPVLAASVEQEIIRLQPSEAGVSVQRLPDLQRHADMVVLVGAGGMSPYARVSTLKPVLVREQR